MRSNLTVALLFPQELSLFGGSVDECVLDLNSTGETPRKRTLMVVTASYHFCYERLVPLVQRFRLAHPAQRLGMPAITAFLLRDDGPYRVQLTMLAKKVLPAEKFWRKIPDAHYSLLEMMVMIEIIFIWSNRHDISIISSE